jgi:hypothetical protein
MTHIGPPIVAGSPMIAKVPMSLPVFLRSLLGASIATFALSGPCLALESIYCGKALVSKGDSAALVNERCGKPSQVTTSYVEIEQSLSARQGNASARLGERELIPVERWRYEAGNGDLPRLLVFKNGFLIDILVGR